MTDDINMLEKVLADYTGGQPAYTILVTGLEIPEASLVVVDHGREKDISKAKGWRRMVTYRFTCHKGAEDRKVTVNQLMMYLKARHPVCRECRLAERKKTRNEAYVRPPPPDYSWVDKPMRRMPRTVKPGPPGSPQNIHGKKR